MQLLYIGPLIMRRVEKTFMVCAPLVPLRRQNAKWHIEVNLCECLVFFFHSNTAKKEGKKKKEEEKKKRDGTQGCILSGFYSLGRVLFGITKCTGRNSGETDWECDRLECERDRPRKRRRQREKEEGEGSVWGIKKAPQPASQLPTSAQWASAGSCTLWPPRKKN